MSEPQPWQGYVYRHIPATSPFGPLDTHLAARSRENRWNVAGEPTLVFASDVELMHAELIRHIQCDRDPAMLALFQERCIFAVELNLQRVFDLTDPAVTQALGIQDTPACFANRSIARATAGFLRNVREADGMVVPSVVHPNAPELWNLVVFLDRLSEPLESIVNSVAELGVFQADNVPATGFKPR